jgi:hypothetical protein
MRMRFPYLPFVEEFYVLHRKPLSTKVKVTWFIDEDPPLRFLHGFASGNRPPPYDKPLLTTLIM